MSNEDLLKSFQVISELENRKITYEKAISKVEQEIENAGMWYREAEPIQPTQNLNHTIFVHFFYDCSFLMR